MRVNEIRNLTWRSYNEIYSLSHTELGAVVAHSLLRHSTKGANAFLKQSNLRDTMEELKWIYMFSFELVLSLYNVYEKREELEHRAENVFSTSRIWNTESWWKISNFYVSFCGAWRINFNYHNFRICWIWLIKFSPLFKIETTNFKLK